MKKTAMTTMNKYRKNKGLTRYLYNLNFSIQRIFLTSIYIYQKKHEDNASNPETSSSTIILDTGNESAPDCIDELFNPVLERVYIYILAYVIASPH